MLKHKWFNKTKKPDEIFNDAERELISSEFIYLDESEKGKKPPNVDELLQIPDNLQEKEFKPMKSGIFNFGLENLHSTMGAEGGGGQISGASELLAPFNSSMSETGLKEYNSMKRKAGGVK